MVHGKMIRVLYFAQIAEITGKHTEELPLEQAIPANLWLQNLLNNYPEAKKLKHINIALNKEHINLNQMIQPGDEVAIFEPVTGG